MTATKLWFAMLTVCDHMRAFIDGIIEWVKSQGAYTSTALLAKWSSVLCKTPSYRLNINR